MRSVASTVLDASAVLASILREEGSERIELAAAEGAAISTVNLAEVVGVLTLRGIAAVDIESLLARLSLEIRPFVEEDGHVTGRMSPLARSHRLSFCDRACLALGRRLGVPVLTGDVAMARAQLGGDPEVVLIR
jgi:PIN domain nuclease of toxin-antitoxin system